MRLLLINPNTSTDLTDRLVEEARALAGPGTEIIGATGHRGMPYIASRAEAVIGAGVVLEILADQSQPIDAAIIAAFGDPGLAAAREMMDVPVVGMAEAALVTACMMGKRFAIVSFSRALGPWYRDCVEANGLANRMASLRLLDSAFSSVLTVRKEKQDALHELARAAIEEDDADVVIFAGAPLSGLARELAPRLAVPVVDPIAAAVLQAQVLATLRDPRPHAALRKRPALRPSKGLTAPLRRLLSGNTE